MTCLCSYLCLCDMCSFIINAYYLLIIHILNKDLQILTFYRLSIGCISINRSAVCIYCGHIRMLEFEDQFLEWHLILIMRGYIIYTYFIFYHLREMAVNIQHMGDLNHWLSYTIRTNNMSSYLTP